MKQFTLLVNEDKVAFVQELLGSLGFVKITQVEEAPLNEKQAAFVEGLKGALHEVDDQLSGKTPLKPAREMLDEL